MKSGDYTPLRGNQQYVERNESLIFNQFTCQRSKQFWFGLAGISAIVVLGLLILSNSADDDGAEPVLRADAPSTSTLNPAANKQDVTLLYGRKWPLPDVHEKSKAKKGRNGIVVNGTVMGEALRAAQDAQASRRQKEDKMMAQGALLKAHSPAEKHAKIFSKTSPVTTKLAADGLSMDQASQFVVQKLGLSAVDAGAGDLKPMSPASVLPCTPPRTADVCGNNSMGIYRGVDGMCNNLKYPDWGSANQPYRRILQPAYANGISSPRMAVSGAKLPHPRKLSTIVHFDRHRDDEKANLMVAALGQFVAHDVSAIVFGEGIRRRVSCCKDGAPAPEKHPECFPFDPSMEIETTTEGATCTSIWRSAPYPSCDMGPRNQFSQTTAFLDASAIYGGNNEAFRQLRDVERPSPPRGYLTTHDSGRLLPVATNLLDGCNIPAQTQKGHFCFTSGDPRVNENMALTAMHLLWVRHHNHLADHMADYNPAGNADRNFMETRELIIAQFQHVVYNEYLPLLLGPDLVKSAGIELLSEGYYNDYDPELNPMISNVFAAAAYRVGHTTLQGHINIIDANDTIMETLPLRELVIDPFRLYEPGYFDGIIRGYAFGAAGGVDTYVTTEFTRHLFENRNGTGIGVDLAAINIQRGRDHGIAGYTAWREACGLQPIENFGQLLDIWDENVVSLARDLYTSVHDIDMYTGMLAERHLPGAMVGPTVGCLVADQFRRLRQGDRFWYESSSRPRPFTPEQLQQIRRFTLARLICDHGDAITKIQRRALETPNDLTNPMTLCTDFENIRLVNYTLWTPNVTPETLPTPLN